MKTSLLKIALATMLMTAWGVAAGEKAKDTGPTKPSPPARAKASKTAPVKEPNTPLTGSYIKRDVHRNGQITDGPNVVLVLDSSTIHNSGASDLRQLLIRQGASH
jgi:hypothetical protein